MSQLANFFKESYTQMGVFYPKHHLIAAFADNAAAQVALTKLRLAGFNEDQAIAVLGEDVLELAKEELGVGHVIMQGLSRFLATEQVSTDEDIERARHGAAFVAVYCPDEKTKLEANGVLQPEKPLAARYYGNGGVEHLAGDLVTN